MGGCYNLKLLYMQTLNDLDLMFSVIYCNILVMNGLIENYIYSHTLMFSYSLIIMLHSVLFIIRN